MVHAIFHESAARSGQCCLGFCLVGSLIAGEPWELMNMSKRKPVSSLSPVQISMRDGIMVQEIAPEQSPLKGLIASCCHICIYLPPSFI